MGRAIARRIGSGRAVLLVDGGVVAAFHASAALGDRFCHHAAGQLGAVAASVEYRLAPRYPYPAPLEDCYAALRWLARQPDVDAERVAIAGESAGGGLAAALALLSVERAEVRPVFQALSYPMLDGRTAARTDIAPRSLRMWSRQNNRLERPQPCRATPRGSVSGRSL
ncbi:alpha/beta hydrolase fold domain-containing protein [Nocardia abscessus]|nr:alpha/beta hydrolase fold domain-containing protein [Nocardia abscessus]